MRVAPLYLSVGLAFACAAGGGGPRVPASLPGRGENVPPPAGDGPVRTVTPAYDRAAIGTAIRAIVQEPDSLEGLLLRLEQVADRTARGIGQLTGIDPDSIRTFLTRQVIENLEAKRELSDGRGGHFTLPAAGLRRTVIDYEAFKLETFATAGVFPKRYFGYFDERWDTAAYEVLLRKTVHRAVGIINQHQGGKGSMFRLTDAEVAITFLSEGGAILLRERQDQIESIDPVHGIGLDDIRIGFGLHADLVERLDEAFGTGLGEIVPREKPEGAQPGVELRSMTFVEALLGTAVMYLYEKELAAAKMRDGGDRGLSRFPLDEQFVITSLVYNSGILFEADRIRMIRSFSTSDYLYGVTKANEERRPLLPVLPPRESIERLLADGRYPDQPTSWSAVYHILQRYGAFVAIARLTDVFDRQGTFRIEG